jgi:hypothetical protein
MKHVLAFVAGATSAMLFMLPRWLDAAAGHPMGSFYGLFDVPLLMGIAALFVTLAVRRLSAR